jgi:steroid delta-isomerase-like uncharacterized protein
MDTNVIEMEAPLPGVDTNERILRCVMTALNEGRISEAVNQFDDHFSFNDHALDLEFTAKERLTEFFQKSRELFADSHLEVESFSECGDHVIARWKLTATQDQNYGGFGRRRVRISLQGVSIAYFENERIVRWSDFYDATKSWRFGLAGLFKDWIEY